MTFADKVIQFNKNLRFTGKLPGNVRVMNPFTENQIVPAVSSRFYRKYYDDNRQRKLRMGINPGRFGAGVTGIPFTDTKRLEEKCNLKFPDITTHEPSSVFVYEVVDAYGGPEKFYGDFYISALSPLGYVIKNRMGKEVNYNFYDSREMIEATKHFIVQSLTEQISFGVNTEICYCLGTGKNFKFFEKLNNELLLFDRIIPLEHPRYVMQYKSKSKKEYINKYIQVLSVGLGK